IEGGVVGPVTVMAPDERWAWVALAQVPAVAGNFRRYHDLLRLGAPVDTFRMARRVVASAVGEEAAESLAGFDWCRAAREQAGAAARVGARLVLLDDPEYPRSLRSIDLPPPFLLVRGNIQREDGLGVAIVGSRRATPYGLQTAERLAAELGERGV